MVVYIFLEFLLWKFLNALKKRILSKYVIFLSIKAIYTIKMYRVNLSSRTCNIYLDDEGGGSSCAFLVEGVGTERRA